MEIFSKLRIAKVYKRILNNLNTIFIFCLFLSNFIFISIERQLITSPTYKEFVLKGISVKLFLGYFIDGELKVQIRNLGIQPETLGLQIPGLTFLEKGEKKYIGVYLEASATLVDLKAKEKQMRDSLNSIHQKLKFSTKRSSIFPVVFIG